MSKAIIDISHHQPPSKINYDVLSQQIDWVIIRTQYGLEVIDTHYKTHHNEFQKRGIPTAAYAYVLCKDSTEATEEAKRFYGLTKNFQPTFWFLDVEEAYLNRENISIYQKSLRELGAKKVGVYVAHHLYKTLNLKIEEFDAVWIPRYGTNDGTPQKKPDYPCDLWQYTSKGRLEGYNGDLDLNCLTGTKPLEYFINNEKEEYITKKQLADIFYSISKQLREDNSDRRTS